MNTTNPVEIAYQILGVKEKITGADDKEVM